MLEEYADEWLTKAMFHYRWAFAADVANAAALQRGAETAECVIDGRPWTQRRFPYQGKCLRWLREGYAALAGGDRAAVDALLAGTGCARLFIFPHALGGTESLIDDTACHGLSSA